MQDGFTSEREMEVSVSLGSAVACPGFGLGRSTWVRVWTYHIMIRDLGAWEGPCAKSLGRSPLHSHFSLPTSHNMLFHLALLTCRCDLVSILIVTSTWVFKSGCGASHHSPTICRIAVVAASAMKRLIALCLQLYMCTLWHVCPLLPHNFLIMAKYADICTMLFTVSITPNGRWE